MLVLCAALAIGAEPPEEDPPTWDFRAEAGAQLDFVPHGVANVGVRRRDLSIQWLTDTLDIRMQPSWDRGRAWIALRAEVAMAGLLTHRFADGARTPDQDLFAFYEGLEGGGVAYLPAGFYAGASLSARYWHFLATPNTTREVPGGRPVLTMDGLLGFWHPMVHVWVRAGTDWTLGWQPHVHGQLTTDIPGIVRPAIELRAGWGQDKDEVTATRMGGLNPYVIPLAGATWAEFLVEDYVGGRAGLIGGPESWQVGMVWDGVWHDGDFDQGFAIVGGTQGRGRWIEASLGWAPWLQREKGPALAAWILFGVDWGKGLGPRGTPPE